MKILLTADLHIGSPLAGLSPEKTAIRKQELISVLPRMIGYADKNGIDTMIIAGDLFDSSRVSRRIRGIIADQIASAPGITFYYLRGNHDGDLTELPLTPDNLKTFGEEWTYHRSGNTVFAGRERVSPDMYGTLELDRDDFNIVVLHGQESLSRTQTEGIISYPLLENKNVDLLALGHLHYFHTEKLGERGIAVYPGCPEGRGFDECGEKGFVVIDTSLPAGKNISFVRFAERTIHEITVKIDRGDVSVSDIDEKIGSAISGIPSGDMVKVVLEGETGADAEKDDLFIERKLASRFFLAKCKDNTRLYIDPEKYKTDPSLKGELVRTLAKTDADPGLLRDAALAALAALRGDEVE